MATLRSLTKTSSSSARSPLTFQTSATRLGYSSTSSPSREGKVMIRNCAPLGSLASASSFSLRACSCSELRIPPLSVTQAVGLGGTSRARAAAAMQRAIAAAARRLCTLTCPGGGCGGAGTRTEVEVHVRRLVGGRRGDLEVRLLLEPGHVGHHVGRELL